MTSRNAGLTRTSTCTHLMRAARVPWLTHDRQLEASGGRPSPWRPTSTPTRNTGSVHVTCLLIGGLLTLASLRQLGDEVHFVMGPNTKASVGRVVAIHMTTDLRVCASLAHGASLRMNAYCTGHVRRRYRTLLRLRTGSLAIRAETSQKCLNKTSEASRPTRPGSPGCGGDVSACARGHPPSTPFHA